ncbi:enoyl-CoA hydratase-related protein [Streptomyces sp. R35]|uniref:Enoyl-CoA hydratase-related protein n=1 Tax=Streptomyces sp. R35 TaxID=3238630 RepID=A0AB39SLX6_9ACTN
MTEPHTGVLLITLNRPHVRNAIDRSLAQATDVALTRLETDPRLAVGILAGTGGHFCSGMDLKAFPTDGVPVVADRGSPG